MDKVLPGSHYRFEQKMFKRAIVLAVLLHVGAISLLFAGNLFLKPKDEMPPIMSVGLTGIKSLSGPGGKKTKAPVMRKNQAPKPKPTTSKPKKKNNKKKVDPKKEVGLNTKKTTKKEQKETTPEPESTNTNTDTGRKKKTGGTGGMADSGISFEVGGGQETQNLEDLPYLAYLQSVQSELAQRWARAGLTGGVTTVTFRINKDGSIQDAHVSESSGKRHLDGPALRAVLGARLPPLPQGCRDDYLILHYRFHYGEP